MSSELISSGILTDGGGIIIIDGKIIQVPPWTGPFAEEIRDISIGLATIQMASLINDRDGRFEMQKMAANLVSVQGQRLAEAAIAGK